jgi:hypothetical protein
MKFNQTIKMALMFVLFVTSASAGEFGGEEISFCNLGKPAFVSLGQQKVKIDTVVCGSGLNGKRVLSLEQSRDLYKNLFGSERYPGAITLDYVSIGGNSSLIGAIARDCKISLEEMESRCK